MPLGFPSRPFTFRLTKKHECNSHNSCPLPVQTLNNFMYFICYIKNLGDDFSFDNAKLLKFEIEILISCFRVLNDGKSMS
jgi:hypothetical protein